MRYCIQCGAPLPEGSSVCPNCGSAQPGATVAPDRVLAPQDAYAGVTEFQVLKRRLHQEARAWTICGIAMAVVVGMLVLIGFVMIIVGVASGEGAISAVGALYALLYGTLLGPIPVISLIMGKKVMGYYDKADTDCSDAYSHMYSVGSLVFTILFGEVAAIFHLIGFIWFRTRRQQLEAFRARQQSGARVG